VEIFLDSLNIDAISKYRFLIKGITTNPSLLQKHGEGVKEVIKEISDKFPDLKINLQVFSTQFESMKYEAEKIVEMGANFIVKAPINLEGLKLIEHLSSRKIKTNATLCFSLSQAKLAENAGATYISPFIGRMESSEIDIKSFLENLIKSIKESKVLAASIRSISHLNLAIASNCPAATFSEQIMEEVFNSELLKDGEKSFLEAANSVLLF
jgi:transaldolase